MDKYVDIEYNDTEECILYYVNTEDSEQQTINITKQEVINELGYEQRNRFDEVEFTDGSVIDKFNGEHSQEENWQLLSEWNPSDEELYKIIEIKH